MNYIQNFDIHVGFLYMNNHEFGNETRLKIHIVVVSSTRTLDNDQSGKLLMNHFRNHELSISISRENYQDILKSVACNLDKDAIVMTGGTGPSVHDITVQTLNKISEKEIRGFGELFRLKSENDAAYFSNTSLFLIGKTQIYCLPGSLDSVRIGAELIDSFIYHVHHELHKE